MGETLICHCYNLAAAEPKTTQAQLKIDWKIRHKKINLCFINNINIKML